METKIQYVRCLRYSDAVQFIVFVNSLKGCYAAIECGGIYTSLTPDGYNEAISYLDNSGLDYEISHKHPSESRKEIIATLKSL